MSPTTQRFHLRPGFTLTELLVVIALIVTSEGYPLAYEVLAGNTQDKQTLREFLKKIENLTDVIDGIDPEEYFGEKKLWSSLDKLLKIIRSKLRAAGRRVGE